MVSLRFFGVELVFRFSFFAAVGIILALDKSGYGLLCLMSCLCHEAGHLAVMLISGDVPKALVFSGGGICIKQRKEASVPVIAAGCLVNFILFTIFYFSAGNSIYRLVFAVSNLCVGIMNLLPIGDLDGKKLLERLLTAVLPFDKAQRVMKITEFTALTLAGAGAAFLLVTGALSKTAAITLVYIFLVDLWSEKC